MTTLNSQQEAAVLHDSGPALVIAGAGSGKTRIVTERIARLIENGTNPASILALTFTNKAAQEMKERVHRRTNAHVLISTFHSLGVRLLRESGSKLKVDPHFIIFDDDDSLKLIKTCIATLGKTEKDCPPRYFRERISDAKNALKAPQAVLPEGDSPKERLFPQVYAMYQARLQECGALDFDDLLFSSVALLRDHPDIATLYSTRYSYLLVDEYQDTNAAQYTLLRLLCKEHRNLFVVGDPDQSIYSWRGADIGNILSFEQDFPGATVIALEQNYRSTQTILSAANAVIANNKGRYKKNLWSARGEGEPIEVFAGRDEHDECDFVCEKILYHKKHGTPLEDMVIFYRTNFQSRQFEDALLNCRIPYTVVGGLSFYQRKEIKDIIAYLRIIFGGADYISFARCIQAPKRGLGSTTIEKLCDLASEKKLSIIDAVRTVVRNEVPELKISAKQKQSLHSFLEFIANAKPLVEAQSIQDLVLYIIEQSSYIAHLREEPESFDERKANIEELVAKAAQWQEQSQDPSVGAFLEELSLKSSLDESTDSTKRLKMMTLHTSKGLEFSVAFIVGLEEDLLPHLNAKDFMNKAASSDIEEERRLFYVGMTRAKDRLYLSHISRRFLWGTTRPMRPSRFLKELPASSPKKREKATISHTFCVGDTLFHSHFGQGKVEASYENSFGLTYDVTFVRDGKKRAIVARFAELSCQK